MVHPEDWSAWGNGPAASAGDRGSKRMIGFRAALTIPGRRLAAAVVAIVISAGAALAQSSDDRHAAIVIDHRTGQVLHAAQADEPRYPASLTKMMTLYMLFEALREGRVQLSTRIEMSPEAASRPPSRLGLPAGASLSAENAILALVTKSANDVAAAVGEHLGGTEDRFAQMMTLRARSLGMTRTTFRNASGLPDFDQTTTARDMATLGRRLIQDFPNRYHYFGTVHAQVGRLRLRNHNRMLDSYDGADGIKTGYIRDSGFNIVTSAQRDGVRLVGAVFGGRSWVERDAQMATLLDQGFERLGVAPRSGAPYMAAPRSLAPVMAARPPAASRTGILGAAAAATLARAPVTGRTQSALARSSAGRAPLAAPQRHAARRVAARGGARVEQGSRATTTRGTAQPARRTAIASNHRPGYR